MPGSRFLACDFGPASGQAGRPDAAYRNISNWFTSVTEANAGYGGGSFNVNLGPNTMYQEANGAPCNESPLGAAFAIQNWLLSSWRFGAPEENANVDTIRAFPAVPSVLSTWACLWRTLVLLSCSLERQHAMLWPDSVCAGLADGLDWGDECRVRQTSTSFWSHFSRVLQLRLHHP